MKGIVLLFIVSGTLGLFEEILEVDSSFNSNNCSTTGSVNMFRTSSETQRNETEIIAQVLIDETKNDTNITHLKTFAVSKDWNDLQPKLKFPNISLGKQYKISSLHLDQGMFIFDFLRKFLSIIQPFDVPADLLMDAMEDRISMSKLISEVLQLEAILIAMMGLCCILCFVVPGIELWLACRPIREDFKPTRHSRTITFLLTIFIFILGIGMITTTVYNETISATVQKLPIVVEAALQDLNDYHNNIMIQLRECFSGSLDIASEAILMDLDNIFLFISKTKDLGENLTIPHDAADSFPSESVNRSDIDELLGRPVQAELSAETGLDIALNTLMDLANNSQALSKQVGSLLSDGEKAHNLGKLLNLEIEDLRRNLKDALNACTGQDHSLCNTLDSSGLRLTLGLEHLVRDDRLSKLRIFKRGNLTETIRQIRGEFLYISQHIASDTLDIRNQIRREVNKIRARIFDEARKMEVSNSELREKLMVARRVVDDVMPYVIFFEHIRWFIGIGAPLCILPFWLLLFGALCCRCHNSDNKVRPTLLCAVSISCIISIVIWVIFIMALTLSSHIEMLVCRPLHDLNYQMMEVVLETRIFLGKKLRVPLKDLFMKCRQNEAAYPALGLGNTLKIEQLTAYWTWSNFTKLMFKLKIELKTLRIFTPYLQQQLQDLLYAYELNSTEHRIMIQEPILNKDLYALSDQMNRVARQMSNRMTARSLETIAINMQDLTLTRLKPLLKLKDELLYKLASLEFQMQPLQQQVNQSISHLNSIQHYIDNQGDKIAQLKTKLYVDRLDNYLDQWRSHVLSKIGNGATKCRPLWDVLEGISLLLCNHFLGNLSGYWFATLLCAITIMASTPTAHILSLVYRNVPGFERGTTPEPLRSESPQTVEVEEDSWHTPDPPPPPPDERW